MYLKIITTSSIYVTCRGENFALVAFDFDTKKKRMTSLINCSNSVCVGTPIDGIVSNLNINEVSEFYLECVYPE